MAGGDRQLAFTTGPVPTSVQVSGPDRVTPKTVNASFDGTGAAGPFLPCLIITGRTGHEVARIPAPQVAAGASAEVSWFPRVGGASAAPPPAGITEITSADGSVVVTDPFGPVTDLSVPPPAPSPPLRYVTMISGNLNIPSGSLKTPDFAHVDIGSATNDVTGFRQLFTGDATFNGTNFRINTATNPHQIFIKRSGIYAATVFFDVEAPVASAFPPLFGVEMNMSGVVGTNSMTAMIGGGITTPSASVTSVHVFTGPTLFSTSALQYSGVTFTSATISVQLVRLGDFS